MKPSRGFFVILHNIRSLYNVGSIFRTADAFGIDRIYLTGYTGRPDHPLHGPKIAKTALGGEKTIPWEYSKSPIRLLKTLAASKVRIIGLENNVPMRLGVGSPKQLLQLKPVFPLVLVLGEEVDGINKNILKLCNTIVEIPMRGQKESLNVSVAFGIAAYEIAKARSSKRYAQIHK